jgi:sulfite exporter TauE/SafE
MTAQELMVAVLAGALAGVASIAHCAAMCGPLSCVATAAHPGRLGALRYQLGRTLSYGALGALVGAAGGVVVRSTSGAWAGALISWVFAAALGVAAYRLWRVDRPVTAPANTTVSLSTQRPKPTVGERLLGLMPRDPLLFGAATALLPCGALYGALVLAAGSAHPAGGLALMMGFATTTGVGLVGIAWIGKRIRPHLPPLTLRLVAVALAAAAVFIAIRPAQTLAEPEAPSHTCCGVAD